MTDSISSKTATAPESEFDPQTVADRDGVETGEQTYVHGDPDHCEADAAGRVIVGVTNAQDETLLLVDHDRSIALLPNATVDTDGAWRATARRAVTDESGLDVTLGDPICVREIEHTTEQSETSHNETFHVVFEASARYEEEPIAPDDSPFEADWFDTLPFEVATDHAGHGDALADVERVLG